MLYFRLYYTVKEFLYNFREALEYIPPEKEKEKFKHNKASYSFFKLMILFLFCSYALWYILKVTITP